MSSQNSQLAGPLYNWTDDLPVCKQSGVGYQTNHLYRAGGGRGEVIEYEDRSFHFECPDDCYLYGIIDGHDGAKVADFVVQKLPAELLLGQLKDNYTGKDVCLKLQEAFESVAKGFVEDLINDSLMEKMNLEEQMPEGMRQQDAFQRFPSLFQRLKVLERAIAGGCSAVIALIHKSRLFVANVGDARALLCRADEKSGELGVVQLTTDHTISTMSELQRLANLGLDIEKLQVSGILRTTRSLGDWALKGGYKNTEVLSVADEEPILSAPSVHGGEEINSSMKFLILMSQGVYTAYEQATGTPPGQVNSSIASMIHHEIMKQMTIEGVAQAVVDQICRLHQDQFSRSHNQKCLKRDDMTLLVRLFNIQLNEPSASSVTSMESSNKPVKKSANLPLLKMPPATVSTDHTSTTSTPNSTGSDTPTSTTPGSKTSTPGSAGSATTSPSFSYPFPRIQAGMRTPSPLTVAVTTNPAYQQPAQLQELVDSGEQQRQYLNHENESYMPVRQLPFEQGSHYPAQRAAQHQQTGIILHQPSGNTTHHHVNIPQDDNVKEPFRGFTDEDQNNFFRGRPPQHAYLEPGKPHSLLIVSQRNDHPTTESAVESGTRGSLDEHPPNIIDSNNIRSAELRHSDGHSSSGSGYAAVEDKTRLFNRPAEPLETDQDGRIKAYVDFTEFVTNINASGGEKDVFAKFISRGNTM